MTMLLEKYLGMSKPSRAVYISVGMMLGGAGVAALSDVSFDAKGYAMILANDFLTAFYGITMKRAMSGKSVTKSSLMFYNALFSSIAMVSLRRTYMHSHTKVDCRVSLLLIFMLMLMRT
jgi:drug/metabolite transporter (DMT)-like permease